jgi:hypothetical protein
MTIRWLNLGRTSDSGSGHRILSGEEYTAPLFRLCSGCGKLDSRTGQNSAAEHRPWCSYRKSNQESVREIVLARTLNTEAVVIQLPAAISVGDRFAVPSLLAALQLGLREYLGGAPDHLALEQIIDPHFSDGTENRDAILIHDTVPGGTGYLAELADPTRFYSLLYRAWILVRDCPCKDEGRASCHRCLSPFINSSTQKHISRAAAERYLKMILLGDSPTDGEPSEAIGWAVTEKPTHAYDPETHIEQKFRKVLHERLTKGLGASVQEHPGPNGNRWTINPGGGRTWVMEPQLALGGVQPDFVFYCNDQNIPRLALFCDGWQFHASPVINRIADDATKRAMLRDQGYVVLALTWQDLLEAETGTPSAPPWFSEERWTQAMAATNGTLKPSMRELTKGGPIDYLTQWISNPDPAGIEALAEALPLLLAGSGPVGKTDSITPLSDLARSIHDGAAFPLEGDRRAWAWKFDTLTAVARNVSEQGVSTEVVVLLDDRGDRLGHEHKSAWREWIRFANLLNQRLQASHVTAYTLEAAAPSKSSPGGAQLHEPWASLYKSAVSQEEKRLIALLAESGVPAPSLGHEAASGLPIDISWPEYKIAIDLDLQAEDREELGDDGWTLVAPDLHLIQDMLADVGGH